MINPQFRADLFTPLRLWLFVIGLTLAGGTFVLKESVVASSPRIAARRAVEQTLGPGAGTISVSGPYAFKELNGSSSRRIKLVCGSVGPDRQRGFAGLVHRSGRRPRLSSTYRVEELVFTPAEGSVELSRETQLLAACAQLR